MLYLDASLAAYLVACVLYFIHIAFKNDFAGKAAPVFFSIGFVANTAAVVLRWIAAGHPPLSNMFETMVFFAWAVAFVYLAMESAFRFTFLGAFASLLPILALAYASLLDSSVKPLLPALRSNWLVLHVVSYFIGYGAAAVASAASAAYLVVSARGQNAPALAEKLDAISYPLIVFAFPFLTIGLTTGAVWANRAWGSYWSWDPKETWSLITWLVYALYLHVRVTRGVRGTRAALVALGGFGAILFTFLGVNLFFGGMHSYR